MAFLSNHPTYQMRSLDKEPQWATVYDDLFNQYIDTDVFEFGTHNTTSSSDETSNETVASIEGLTDSGESSSPDTSRHSDDFWAKTLQALEESAATLEQEEQRRRQTPPALYTKDYPHSDFLSLGGYPSPHISSTPTSPSEAARRRKAARHHAEQSDRTSDKPQGVTKAYRSSSKSPKMMTPSRYRAGFRDVSTENMYRVPNMTMNLPVRTLPLSPPPSGRRKHMAVSPEFCSPREVAAPTMQPFIHFDEQVSPFSSSFPQSIPAHMQTPNSSPLTTPGVERGATFSDAGQDTYYESMGSFHKTSWSANSFEAEDIYEPSPTFSPWLASERTEPECYNEFTAFQPTTSFTNLQQSSTNDLASSGLMISYDPTLAPSHAEEIANELDAAAPTSPYYIATESLRSPRRQSLSPSPQRRQPRTPSKGHSRKTSSQQSPRAAMKGGFVNFTPSDSEKLLTGVAPSGSSKTKARREREAAEKRRRFSQAAVKAVVEAGGNVAALRDVGLLVG